MRNSAAFLHSTTLLIVAFPAAVLARTFSVECVDNYDARGGPSISLNHDNANCNDVHDNFIGAGLSKKWDWREGDVWGNDGEPRHH